MRNQLVAVFCCLVRLAEPFVVRIPSAQSRGVRLAEKIFYNDFEDFSTETTTSTTLKAPPSSSDWRAFRKNLLSETNTKAPEELWAHETSLVRISCRSVCVVVSIRV